MSSIRLDKIISSQLNISRSEARTHIRRGEVSVNGGAVRDPSLNFDPENSEIIFKGQALNYKKHLYIMLNKPKGVLSASTDKSRETVVDLVPEHLKRSGLFPVGRLDRDTTGLLIITDDGDYAHKIISPKSGIKKTYRVVLDGKLTPETAGQFKEGIVLADGAHCHPAELKITGENSGLVIIDEGKYHQIKRMFGAVGLGVVELHRMKVGGLFLPDDLECGNCRELTPEEVNISLSSD